MSNQSNPEYVLSGEYILSLRSAKVPFRNGHSGHHWFLLLVVEGPDPHIFEELHFIPVNRDGSKGLSTEINDAGPYRPDIKFIGTAAYVNPRRTNLKELELFTITHDEGTSRRMLNVWNNALHAALKIRELGRQFDEGNDCKSSMEAVLDSLGYNFESYAALGIQRSPDAGLAAAIGPHLPGPIPGDHALLENFRSVHRQLQVPYPITIGGFTLTAD